VTNRRPRGRMRPEYWVTCGLCSVEKCCCESTKEKSAITIQSQGWEWSTSHGWICPDCRKRID
jgi:hypothetical protein